MSKDMLVVLQLMAEGAQFAAHPMAHSATNRQFFPQDPPHEVQIPLGQKQAAEGPPHFLRLPRFLCQPPLHIQKGPLLPPNRALSRTSTPCLHKPVLARDTHGSKARYVTAMAGIAMLAMAEITSKQTAWGRNVWYNVVMNRMQNPRHVPRVVLPLPMLLLLPLLLLLAVLLMVFTVAMAILILVEGWLSNALWWRSTLRGHLAFNILGALGSGKGPWVRVRG